jgi:hypothetical protein
MATKFLDSVSKARSIAKLQGDPSLRAPSRIASMVRFESLAGIPGS